MTTIAIDGPAGAGKSSIARALSKRLSLIYLDTGAMYRALGLKVLMEKLDPFSRANVLFALENSRIDVRIDDTGEQHIYLDDEDVSGKIRTNECSRAASAVSAIPEVRERLVALQRELAKGASVVMDGRDIGTVVLKDADFKFFVTASARKRAERRHLELIAKGLPTGSVDDLEKEMLKRDFDDSHREHSPLRKAKDAVLVDTTDMTLEQAVEHLCGIVEGRRKL